MNNYNFEVSEDHHKVRLDVFLVEQIPEEYSRSFIQKMIVTGRVTVNQKRVKPHYKILTGEKIEVEIEEADIRDERIGPEKISLDIFYEDKDILVINKPIGMLVHPANSSFSGTLVNALLHHCDSLSDVNTKLRPGIVHRLDRDTSGLILVAKNNPTHVRLARQFEKRRVKKRYVALVSGIVDFDEGLIDAPIGKHPRQHDLKKVIYSESSKEASTIYRVIKRLKKETYVGLYPKTGRTHQLRVHMSYLKHPILGDEKYGKKSTFPRLALHAQSIAFLHPTTKKFVQFSCPPPSEFTAYVKENQ